jgi:hypothetical protein
MLRATPQLSSALPRPAFGSCQIHPADTYLMGRRRRCSRKRTRTPSGVCSADRNIRAAPGRSMIDGQSSQRYVPAAPPSGLTFTACQIQHARATVELTRHPCQLAAHFLPCARPPDICRPPFGLEPLSRPAISKFSRPMRFWPVTRARQRLLTCRVRELLTIGAFFGRTCPRSRPSRTSQALALPPKGSSTLVFA